MYVNPFWFGFVVGVLCTIVFATAMVEFSNRRKK